MQAQLSDNSRSYVFVSIYDRELWKCACIIDQKKYLSPDFQRIASLWERIIRISAIGVSKRIHGLVVEIRTLSNPKFQKLESEEIRKDTVDQSLF